MLIGNDMLDRAFLFSLDACDLEDDRCACKGTGWIQDEFYRYICCPVHYAMQPCPEPDPLFVEINKT